MKVVTAPWEFIHPGTMRGTELGVTSPAEVWSPQPLLIHLLLQPEAALCAVGARAAPLTATCSSWA